MLSKKMEKALNDQANYEAFASSAYLAMASWCAAQGLSGCEAFFYLQSAEETVHYLKMFQYINEVGGRAKVAAVQAPDNEFKTIADVFKTALGHEQEVTRRIHKIVELALESKDYASHQFLQWYVAEQVEEESSFQGILDKLKLAGKDDRGLLMIDQYIGRMRSQPVNNAAA